MKPEILNLLGNSAALIDNYLKTFRNNLYVPSSRAVDYLALEDWTDR